MLCIYTEKFVWKKERSADTWCHMDEPWKYSVELKKPDAKHHKLYGSIYRKCPEQANSGIEKRFEVA